MKRIFFAALSLLLSFGSSQLFAHALWIETSPSGKIGQQQTVRIFYGEYASNERDGIDKWYSDVKDCSLWLIGPDQKKTRLSFKEAGGNSFEATFAPDQNGAYVLEVSHEAKELAGTTKYHFLATASVAVGKIAASAKSNNVLNLSMAGQPTFKVNTTIQLKAIINDSVAKGKTVSVFSPSGWSKEVPVSEKGTAEFVALWPGRYVVEVSDFDKTPGQQDGKEYKAVWKGATYSFVIE